ncbi:hypothetical protein GCM10011409_35220 [Lentibacillus populi]|uniref:Lactate dehydrogenase n=1 Tax=Lentibacillus populi TaxID=1827502 RepID=A0A9W5X790_9BACI|nr:Ldh family oxidoreductase [Lentibacillus populi]GGB54561.1 hypothetical protein GCM10011409_35220 [Lentibacillus populi]
MGIYQAEDLQTFVSQVLQKLDVQKEDAKVVAEGLIRANLEGLDSHGISRLVVYAARLQDKRINNHPDINIKMIAPSAILVDGDNGLGHVVAFRGLKEGIEVAKEQGLAAVSIHSSNHFGTASYFCQLASQEGMIFFACTNSPPGIAPWGGTKAFFGTNPLAFGFPAKDRTPVIIDMSTSTVARGKIILAAKQEMLIPDGWALDQHGNMTNDPNEALQGTILPTGGAKGAALALAVEILAGVLTGAAISPNVKNIYDEKLVGGADVGHFFLLLDSKVYKESTAYENRLNYLLNLMKGIPTSSSDKPIRYPGERREKERKTRNHKGIELAESIYNELEQLGDELGVMFPSSCEAMLKKKI